MKIKIIVNPHRFYRKVRDNSFSTFYTCRGLVEFGTRIPKISNSSDEQEWNSLMLFEALTRLQDAYETYYNKVQALSKRNTKLYNLGFTT